MCRPDYPIISPPRSSRQSETEGHRLAGTATCRGRARGSAARGLGATDESSIHRFQQFSLRRGTTRAGWSKRSRTARRPVDCPTPLPVLRRPRSPTSIVLGPSSAVGSHSSALGSPILRSLAPSTQQPALFGPSFSSFASAARTPDAHSCPLPSSAFSKCSPLSLQQRKLLGPNGDSSGLCARRPGCVPRLSDLSGQAAARARVPFWPGRAG